MPAETEEPVIVQATVSAAWTSFFLSKVVSRAKRGPRPLMLQVLQGVRSVIIDSIIAR